MHARRWAVSRVRPLLLFIFLSPFSTGSILCRMEVCSSPHRLRTETGQSFADAWPFTAGASHPFQQSSHICTGRVCLPVQPDFPVSALDCPSQRTACDSHLHLTSWQELSLLLLALLPIPSTFAFRATPKPWFSAATPSFSFRGCPDK